MTFSSLGLSPALLAAVAQLGHSRPTPIQQEAIAPALAGRDLLSSAQTGSGKTLAFALPLLQRLQPNTRRVRQPQALVLVPTRELAAQVGEVIQALAQKLPQRVKVSVFFGGVSINPQMMSLRGGTDVVVATPGRLLDLVAHNALKLDAVALLVLDEADRMLDLGFADELAQVLMQLPAQRQNLFFSATFSPGVTALANTLLHDPVRVEVDAAQQQPMEIIQRAIAVDTAKRTQLLRQLMQQHAWPRALVFVATKFAAEIVADKLRKGGLTAEPFHGELSQGKRTQVLTDFKLERLQVVVATDVAARGLDIVGLPVVVNFDLPRSTQDYTHRIGRTGRAGEPGLALSFVSSSTQAHWRLIEKRQQVQLELESVPGFEAQDVAPPVSTSADAPAGMGNGGVKGLRPSKKDKLRAAGVLPPKAPA
ncbi:DEAD/DEAH box helicase [Rhodoferax antarcticus]|uniref:DEAD/DEAH box helicase domain protein n=1 Tax=Rhodoferax antarcticus ANT.BR TaxID=1111071 RepID=A0A1Q8YD68_9BURK|nr:DEAD/DEAH box helicase [Rhodoferax antarcticus]APW48199.1 RNA helicase [Rhodoferax antarcticus]OLP05770.1 DEAD/DEAH box helicase domain protein [Rhodoferax antarcticus ANT.BR]